MRVLVTGAGGYIGWALVHELRAHRHQVVALVRQSVAEFPADVEVRRADLLHPVALGEAVADVDAVCHLAGLARARSHATNPTRFYQINVGGIANLLDAMSAAGVRRLVFASTAAVYGMSDGQPFREAAVLGATNPYGASKVACEELLGFVAGMGQLGAVSLRIFNAAGAAARRPDLDSTRIIPRTLEVAAGRFPHLTINGDGSVIRDFVHVIDVARAFTRALDTLKPGIHTVCNVGATHASVRDIVDVAQRTTGREIPVRYQAGVLGETTVLTADVTRARTDLGWRPQHSTLEEIISDQWRCFAGD